jgi:hypothetical protein
VGEHAWLVEEGGVLLGRRSMLAWREQREVCHTESNLRRHGHGVLVARPLKRMQGSSIVLGPEYGIVDPVVNNIHVALHFLAVHDLVQLSGIRRRLDAVNLIFVPRRKISLASACHPALAILVI